MTYEEAMRVLFRFVADAKATAAAHNEAAEALAVIGEHVNLIRKRYADKECVRLGHVLRHACTPEQIYEATQRARAEHPEAWEGRIPAVWTAEEVR